MPRATADDVVRMRRHYFAKISLVDEQIGKLLDSLEACGLRENTVILFSSDHGEMLGEHGLSYKWLFYDSVMRVPLIVLDPREPAQAGREVNDLVSLIDLAPTILELAGLKKPSRMEGRSLVPSLRGDGCGHRDYVYAEDNTMLMCRSSKRKLVYYLGQSSGEFYDLEADPEEVNNLWGEAGFQEEITTLKLHLLEWLASSNYHQQGHRCGREDEEGQYLVRWPRPEKNEYGLHGKTFGPPVIPFH